MLELIVAGDRARRRVRHKRRKNSGVKNCHDDNRKRKKKAGTIQELTKIFTALATIAIDFDDDGLNK